MRELFDAYAHCADRRDAEGQKALFTDDTRFAVYMDGEGSEATYVLRRARSAHAGLRRSESYEVTTHFNGQSTVTIDGDRATGESYTIAHHVFTEDGNRKIMIASLRYLDTFTKIDGAGTSPIASSSSTGARRDGLVQTRRADDTATELRHGYPAPLQGSRHPIDAVRLRPRLVRDVRTHGEPIYAVLAAGQMPCDGPWAEEDVQRFRSWLDTGALP